MTTSIHPTNNGVLKTARRASRRSIAAWAGALAALTAVGASARPASACPNCVSEFKPGTYTGEAKRVGNGVAYSWVTLDEKGKPSTIGVTLTETAMEGLTQAAPKSLEEMGRDMFMLMLPHEAKKTAFDHISLDWNAQGHEPMGVYDKPHFDLHFYMLSAEDRQKITATGDNVAVCRKTVPAAFAPAGYIYATGTEVPMMGGHWVDPKAPELNGQPFTKTFLYGSYDGKMIFFEPMITRAYFQTKPDFSEAIPVPTAYTKSAYYPTRYSIRFDSVRHEYTIALDGMTWREAAETKPSTLTAKPATKRPVASPAAARKTARK